MVGETSQRSRPRLRPRYVELPDPRKEGRCSVNVVKAVFVVFNTLFLVSGLVVGGAGIWTYYWQHLALLLMSTFTLELITWLLLVAGVVTLVTALLGCCAVRIESSCLMALYVMVLVAVFMAEVLIGMLSYVYHEQVGADLRRNLRTVFNQEYSVHLRTTKAIDQVQQELSCCGAISFEDWLESKWYFSESKRNRVPDSCCKTPGPSCGVRDHPSNIPYTGCVHPLEKVIQDHLEVIGAIGVGCALLQLVGFFYSTCMLSKLIALGQMIKREKTLAFRRKSPVYTYNRSNGTKEDRNRGVYHPVYSNGVDPDGVALT